MKFIHFADCHLGKYDRNLDIRFKDNMIAVKQIFDFAIQEKVDFVVCTGDFFDNYRPTPDAIVQAFQLLQNLKTHNIPFIVTEGNHDMRRGTQTNSILDILQGAGLAKYVTIAQTPNGDKLKHHEINGVKIYGLGYIRGSNNRATLQKYADMIQGSDNIILIHCSIFGSDIKSKMVDSINAETLAQVFKDKYLYIGLGHYHSVSEVPSLNIYQPGSTERWSSREHPKKYFFMAELDNGNMNVSKHEISIRPWCQFDKEYNDWGTAMRDLKNWVEQNKNIRETHPERAKESIYPIYYIYINGSVKAGYDGAEFDRILSPITDIVYAKINDILVQKYTHSIQDWKVLDEKDMKKEILKEHFSSEFGDQADKMVQRTIDIEDFAETLHLSEKPKDMEDNFRQIQPVIQRYFEFITEHPELLLKKTLSDEKSQSNQSNTQQNEEGSIINQVKPSKKKSKKGKQADLLDLSNNKTE